MTFKIVQNDKCRRMRVVVDNKLKMRHYDLMTEFATRDIDSPNGGGSFPKGWNKVEIYFYLNEDVCDEYLSRMQEK